MCDLMQGACRLILSAPSVHTFAWDVPSKCKARTYSIQAHLLGAACAHVRMSGLCHIQVQIQIKQRAFFTKHTIILSSEFRFGNTRDLRVRVCTCVARLAIR